MTSIGRTVAEVAEAAAGHDYLGALRDVHSPVTTTALAEDGISKIPVLLLESAIAFPGQIIPLRLPRSSETFPEVGEAIRRRSPLGIMCLAAVRRYFCRLNSDNGSESLEGEDERMVSAERLLVGTTVEVIQCSRSDDLRLICRGKERFRCLQVGKQIYHYFIFKCLATPMCTFGPRNSSLFKEIHSFAIPHWKILQHDKRSLAGKASLAYRKIAGRDTMDMAMRDPSMFSYWLSAQLTVPLWYKQILLDTLYDSDRLRRACSIMEKMDLLRCFRCETVVASMDNVIDMTATGGSSSFVNPHGYVHDILTVSRVQDTEIYGAPQRQDSWFQSIDSRSTDKPDVFYGLRLSSISFESLKEGKEEMDMDRLNAQIDQNKQSSRLSKDILRRLKASLES